MKKRLGTIVILLTMITFNAIGQNLQEFKSKLENCGMKLNIPTGFVESKVIENHDMGYDYAIKCQEKDFEVRYTVRPITQKVYANDTDKKKMEDNKTFKNSSYKVILMAIISNVTGSGVGGKMQVFDESAVKKEFNADWGATTFVEPKSDFGKGFKYCMIVAIHKMDIADAFYFFLSNSKENLMENAMPLFHSLQFD